MTNDFASRPPMRDEAAIPHLTRTEQGDGTACYFFGNTTIRVVEAQVEGNIRLAPVAGDQIACGEWVELDEEQVRRYCELLAQHLNGGNMESALEILGYTVEQVQTNQRLRREFELACKKIMEEET